MTDALQKHLDHLTEVAGNFVTHWMEDDGNDADDKARCAEASAQNDNAAEALGNALKAATMMLAALTEIEESLELADKYGFEGELETVRAAIHHAKIGGIAK